MHKLISAAVITLTAALTPALALAGAQVGTLTQVQGEVKIFSHPGKAIQGPAPHALYEGEYYSVRDAKIGDKVEQGNILRTAPGAKSRVVYENGDQFNVGAGTAYRVFWDKDAGNGKTQVNLMYGKLRGVVEKGGPRSKLTVRTSSATMGVRGTDFFIADGGKEKGTEVSILRGEVEVKSVAAKAAAKPIAVKAGYSAEIAPVVPPASEGKAESKSPSAEKKAEAPKVEVKQTTQEGLTAIQKSSQIKKVEADDDIKEEVNKEVAKLEKKAVETTIQDIKKSDPQLYAQIKEKPITSAEDLHNQTVTSLIKEAPKAPEKRKPYMSELEDLENGAYDKYFKNAE